ncbi:MAG: PEP-CTERM sorting domain-containing protein [Phycisphaerae bacterium]|jgi:hypothetical protein
MVTLRLNKALVVVLGVVLCAGLVSQVSAGVVPTAEPTYRDLRTDTVRDWYIFNDSMTDGILDPGDTRIDQMQNWWTPVSSGTQAQYGDWQGLDGNQYDRISAPHSWSTFTLPAGDPNKNNPDYNTWLPREPNAIHFYMGYSQFDNNEWQTYQYGESQTVRDVQTENSSGRNGWVLGWVVNDYMNDPNSKQQIPIGTAKMNVVVHNGKLDANIAGWGANHSDPQVSSSNDLDRVLGLDLGCVYDPNTNPNRPWHPAKWDSNALAYTWAANEKRMTANGFVGQSYVNQLADSQEVKEQVPVYEGQKDQDGNDYIYDDSFSIIHNLVNSTDDGGVLAGLSGWIDPNFEPNQWGDQQVIRIQIPRETLLDEGNINKIVFHDFGSLGGSSQIAPRDITFYADPNGNLFWMSPTGARVDFPDNIIYIAVAPNVPEPMTLGLVGLGGIGLILRRRNGRAA